VNSPFPTHSAAENEQGFISLPGEGRGFVQREWQSAFAQAGLVRVEDFFSVHGNSLSKPGLGKRYRARLEVTRDGETRAVFLKRYEGESTRNLLQRLWEDGERSAVALREVRVARTLETVGIDTFKPLAWGWQGSRGTSQKSFIVMSQVTGDSLERWVPRQNFSATNESWRKKQQLVQQLAQFSKQLHESGWFHRDFYLCHIFIAETDGKIQLALVDLARMFRPRWRVERWRIKDLAQLNFSAPKKYFSRTLRLRFCKIYLGASRLSPAHKKLLRRIARRSEKIAQRESRRNRNAPERI
jgi:heptose I phosphotransferase